MNRFDVCSPRPKKDGGTFWVRLGTAFQGEKGINIVFDALPLPDNEGRVSVSLFEPRDQGNGGGQARTGRQQQNSASRSRDDDLDSDFVPFMRDR